MELRDVTKRFQLRDGTTLKEFVPALIRGKGWSPSFVALDRVSLTVRSGEALGIIGRNGNGKSTLLKLIAGVTAPTEGEVLVRGRVCPLIQLGTGFHPDLTGRENVFLNACILGMSKEEIRERFDEIVEFAELRAFMDTPVKHYSSGMYLRLAFAVAAHSNPDILLIDEVLAVGDAAFQQKCFDRMQEFPARGATVVFVSHSLDLVKKFCHRAIILDAGRLTADGQPPDVTEHYRQMLQAGSPGDPARP
ncbi:MAG TPA: ABC transporter ATP-binding protein [Dehalococcoidia bacterium]|nr:ABC transporter ATP-binding protein [Dehalococcoidia bacterium]